MGDRDRRQLPERSSREDIDAFLRQVAALSRVGRRGRYCRFDATSASQLRDLLSAVAVYASGGRQALERFGKERGGIALQLTHEIDER